MTSSTHCSTTTGPESLPPPARIAPDCCNINTPMIPRERLRPVFGSWRPLRPVAPRPAHYPLDQARRLHTQAFRGPLHRLRRRLSSDSHQRLLRLIQESPQLLRRRPPYLAYAVFAAITLSLAVGAYVAGSAYAAYALKSDVHRQVFVPLWLGVNWPRQRRYPAHTHLAYFVPGCNHDETRLVQKHDVEGQILNALFRLPEVRDAFGVPMSLASSPSDSFATWIEPHYPTLHGVQLDMARTHGALSTTWSWGIRLLRWTDAFGSSMPKVASELASLCSAEAEQKISELSSGRVHQASKDRQKGVPAPAAKDFDVAFSGSFSVHGAHGNNGTVCYVGVIDQTHLGLSHGVRITLLDLTTSAHGESIRYKVL